jgi:phosphoserine phosphatase
MIVVSDMMGTLTTGSPVLGLVDWLRHNQSRLQANLHIAAMLPAYLMVKRGWIDAQAWGQGLMIESLGWIKDATPEKMAAVSEWAVEHNLWQRRRPEVVERLTAHTGQGARVYIASSVVEPMIEPFARRIGAQVIGTPVEYADGRVRVAGQLVAQERKIEQVLARLGVPRVDVAYGDTWMDIPLLEHADHPVAVYPDEKLRSMAEARGWEILGDTPEAS